jgi:hypothetical protein
VVVVVQLGIIRALAKQILTEGKKEFFPCQGWKKNEGK